MNGRRLMVLLLVLPLAAAAQDEPLGQPAGWAVEDTVSLIAVASGSELYLEPDRGSMVMTILPATQLPLVEARGRWVKVRYGDRIGWVDLDGGRGPGEAGPVRVFVTEAEPEPLDLGPGWPESAVGPYKLFSKVHEPALFDELGLIAHQHLRVYAERYGLEVDGDLIAPREAPPPAAEGAGSVVMFAGRKAFLDFQRSHGHDSAEARIDAYFHSPDTVVMYRGDHSRRKLAATLIHELTHLVSWQALRAGGRVMTPMPPWLDEGMAEDLSLSRLDRKARLIATPLRPSNLRYGGRLGATLLNIERQVSIRGTAPSLPQLLAMDKEAFFASDTQLNYLMSAMWIRYLLSDGDSRLAAGFRGFLAAAAEGGRTDPEELRSRLGRSWSQLTGGFRGWLVVEQVRVGK